MITLWIVLGSIAASIAGMYAFTTPAARAKLGDFLSRYMAGVFDVAGPIVRDLASKLQPVEKVIVDAITTYGPILRADLKKPFRALAKGAFDETAGAQTKLGKSNPDTAIDRAAEAFTTAIEFGLSSHAVTVAFESIFPEKLNTLNSIGPLLAKLSGFDEVAKAVLHPVYENAFGLALKYHFRGIFKPELPPDAIAARWHARRLLTDKEFATVLKYSGLKDEYEKPLTEAAYNPISPRALAPLADDNDFDMDDFRELLRFGGHRKADIEIMVRAFQARALKSARSTAQAAAVAFFEAGLIDHDELDTALDEIQENTNKRDLVKVAAIYKRLQTATAAYKAAQDALAEADEITPVQYQTALHALGYIDPVLSGYVATMKAKMDARGFKAARADDVKLAHDRQRLAVQDAMLAYKNREINAAALALALAAAKLDPILIALYVKLAQERGQKKKPKPPTPPAA